MSQLISLIEKGTSIYGSQSALAKELGVPYTHVSMWKSGKRPCTAPDRAALAIAVDEDPTEAVIEAVIEGISLDKPQGKRATYALQVALSNLKATAQKFLLSKLIKRATQGIRQREAKHHGQLSH